MLVEMLKPVENFKKLRTEVFELIDRLNLSSNQISCQGLAPRENNWISGNGRIEELEEEEKLYTHINLDLIDTYIGNIITEFNAFRTRIMIMPEKSCYSIHADPTKRIHIPLCANDQCWMIWPVDQGCFRLYEGLIYLTDTTKKHTFINGSTQRRIHLVMCVD
jgi:hypothetical protein